jgi:hypothetical protein
LRVEEIVTSKVWIAWIALATAGCSARAGLEETMPQAFDPLCGAPRRAIVAEAGAGSELVRLATDTLAEGLSALGFQVLAPRRAFPPSDGRAVNDWIFSSQVIETDKGRVQVNVEVRSQAVTQGVETALAMFENDLLGCRVTKR